MLTITYYGHAAYQITLANGRTLLFDPYRNLLPDWHWFLQPFPALAPDYVVITHPHFDHDEISTLRNTPSLIRDPFSQVEGAGFRLTSVLDRHAKGFGADYGAWNIIFMLESEGIRICHWGDNRSDLPAADFANLGRVDVLILPVEDGAHLLSLAEVAAVIGRLKPRIVLPAHYHIEGLTNPAAGLAGIDGWLAAQAAATQVKLIAENSAALTAATLPADRQIWRFADAGVAGAVVGNAHGDSR